MPNLHLLTQEPRPHTVVEWLFAALVEPVHEVAQRTGLLAELAAGGASADELADRLGLSQRGVRCILNSLVAAGIVAQVNGIYCQGMQEVPDTFSRNAATLNGLLHCVEDGLFDRVTADGILPRETPQALVALGIAEVVGTHLVLTEPGRRYFTPSHDECYLGGHVHYVWKLLSHIIPHLDEVVKTGQPCLRAEKNPGFFGPLVETLFPVNYDAAQQMADHLVTLEGMNRALDLGAGSGVWSIALAQKNPHIQVDALDLPPVLGITRKFVQRHDVPSQFRFLPGDFTAVDRWGDPPYDLIYLGYVCPGSGEAENQRLLTTCVRNLRPGGYIVVADHLPRQDRTGPLLDVLFSILMLCITESGDTYPRESYEAWCGNAGLTQLEWMTVLAWSVPILLARNVGTQ